MVEGVYNKWDGVASTEPTEKDSKEIHIYKASELRWLADQLDAGNNFEGYIIYFENDLEMGGREINGTWENEENERFIYAVE